MIGEWERVRSAFNSRYGVLDNLREYESTQWACVRDTNCARREVRREREGETQLSFRLAKQFRPNNLPWDQFNRSGVDLG